MKKLTFFLAAFLIATLSFSQTSLPITFEPGNGTVTFTDFDGGQTQVIANTFQSGINTSDSIAKHVRNGGQTWAGTYITLDSALDLTNYNALKIKVYSPAADIPVLLKIENDTNSSIFIEKTLNTTVANQWEELTFVYGNQTTEYSKIVIIFNLGVLGDGSDNSTYYFDDIVYANEVTLDPIDLPVTFGDPNVDYDLVDFGGNATTLGANPTDANDTVAITVKTTGAETWAGTTMGTTGFANAIPFSYGNTTMHLSVYSPRADVPVLLKVEDKNDPGIYGQVEVPTTVANQWEVLQFNFDTVIDLSNTYSKASIFFDFGNAGDSSTYYWDDVYFGPYNEISINENANIISVYPNPTSEIFVVNGIDNIQTIDIYSLNGQKANFRKISNNSFDISSLQEGIYIVSILTEDGHTYSTKISKQ